MVTYEWYSDMYIQFKFWAQELYIWSMKSAR